MDPHIPLENYQELGILSSTMHSYLGETGPIVTGNWLYCQSGKQQGKRAKNKIDCPQAKNQEEIFTKTAKTTFPPELSFPRN